MTLLPQILSDKKEEIRALLLHLAAILLVNLGAYVLFKLKLSGLVLMFRWIKSSPMQHVNV